MILSSKMCYILHSIFYEALGRGTNSSPLLYLNYFQLSFNSNKNTLLPCISEFNLNSMFRKFVQYPAPSLHHQQQALNFDANNKQLREKML